MLLHRLYLWPSVISHTKKQSVFTLCFLTKPATCCFAALLRSLSAHFAVPFYTLSFGKLKEQDARTSCSLVKPAMSYFPRQPPAKYLRRWGA